MSRFLEDAERILETAAAASCGEPSRNVAIMLDAAGCLRIVDSEGWTPEGLRSHYGASTLYQVTHSPGAVQVTGWSGARRCLLSAQNPAAVLNARYPARGRTFSPQDVQCVVPVVDQVDAAPARDKRYAEQSPGAVS